MTEEIEKTDETSSFDLHNIFNKKVIGDVDVSKEEPKENMKEKKKPEPLKKFLKEELKKEEIELDPDDEEEEGKEEKSEKKIVSAKEDQKPVENDGFEKLQKDLKETQRWGNETRKQLAAYKRTVEKMGQDGILTEEEARALMDHTLAPESMEQKELSKPEQYGQIWDKEISYMKKYSGNAKKIDESAAAFTHLVTHCTQEELVEIFNDLSAYEDDEVDLTKRMIEIGSDYYDEIYGDIHESGGIRNLKKKYSQKEEEYKKTIDKLQKKYSKLKEKHEDYDEEPPTMRLPQGGSATDLPKSMVFDVRSVFQKRHQSR